MKTFRTLLLISIAFTLSACGDAPTYIYAPKHDGFLKSTGYEAVQVDSATYRVIFYGSRNTSVELADRYAFYRAAELTLEKGFDYYVVVQTGDDDKLGDAWNIVHMFKGALPENDFGAFDAREVTKDMTPFIHREGSSQ